MDYKFIILVIIIVVIGLIILGELYIIRKEINDKLYELDKNINTNKITNINKSEEYLESPKKNVSNHYSDCSISKNSNKFKIARSVSLDSISDVKSKSHYKITVEKNDNTPKIDTPKVESPKVDTPKVDIQKVDSLKIDSPKVENIILPLSEELDENISVKTIEVGMDITKYTYDKLKNIAKQNSIPLTQNVNGTRKYLNKQELYNKLKEIEKI